MKHDDDRQILDSDAQLDRFNRKIDEIVDSSLNEFKRQVASEIDFVQQKIILAIEQLIKNILSDNFSVAGFNEVDLFDNGAVSKLVATILRRVRNI